MQPFPIEDWARSTSTPYEAEFSSDGSVFTRRWQNGLMVMGACPGQIPIHAMCSSRIPDNLPKDNMPKIDSGTICRIIFGKLFFTFGKLGFGKLSFRKLSCIRFLLLRSVYNRLGTSPHLIWGHIRCMHARPRRRKDQLPLRSPPDLRRSR